METLPTWETTVEKILLQYDMLRDLTKRVRITNWE